MKDPFIAGWVLMTLIFSIGVFTWLALSYSGILDWFKKKK